MVDVHLVVRHNVYLLHEIQKRIITQQGIIRIFSGRQGSKMFCELFCLNIL